MARANRVSPRSNSTPKPRPFISGANELSEPSGQRAVYPSLKGKRVLVPGGGSGIGAGIVEAFAQQGSDVTFFDIAVEDSEELAKRTGASFRRVDLTDISAVQQEIKQIEGSGGPVDVLVNNAANDDRHEIEDVTEDYWDNR